MELPVADATGRGGRGRDVAAATAAAAGAALASAAAATAAADPAMSPRTSPRGSPGAFGTVAPPQAQKQQRNMQHLDVARRRSSSSPSLPPSRRSSFGLAQGSEDEQQQQLPTNVTSAEQLDSLPPEFRSGDEDRPLQYEDESSPVPGAAVAVRKYALRPMMYSVAFILLVELLERFCFYGVQYTQTSYLTGAYDEDWNAGMSSVDASTLVSVSTAVAYSAPFVGAVVADAYLGDYTSVLVGTLCLYIPGLALIACTTIPGLLGEEFNDAMLALGLIGLWPVGTGMIKSVINVFGAKQFHPVLQSSLIESYYVYFYMCINIGALVGGVAIPIVAQQNVTVAYFIPVAMLFLGVLVFLSGTPRYVKAKPTGELFGAKKQPKGLAYTPRGAPQAAVPAMSMDMSTIAKISALIVPFNVAYSQMATTFIVQGTVMSKALGFIDAASMNNCDALSVLFFGWVIGSHLYPALARRSSKLSMAQKFSIGSALGALAIGWALIVQYWIHSAYWNDGGRRVSVLWQAPSYVLIGAGEIFAVSSAYEAAFAVSPPDRKAVASAVNLFFVGAVPNFVCIGLYNICAAWFHNGRGTANISRLEDYVQARVGRYFGLLFVVALFGVGLNLLPGVRRWLGEVEDAAAEAMRTPSMTPKMTPRARRAARRKAEMMEEGKPLLSSATRRHRQYLKYGKGPVLNRLGSLRAGVVKGRGTPTSMGQKKKYLVYGGGLARYKGSPAAAAAAARKAGGDSNTDRTEKRKAGSEREATYGSADEEHPPPSPLGSKGADATDISL